MRWGARVTAYFESLTDAFPPFSLDHDAGPGSKSSETICAIIGGLVVVAAIAGAAVLITFLVIFFNREKSRDVSYADVLSDSAAGGIAIQLDDVTFTLVSGDDPADSELLAARPGRRIVQFTIDYEGAEGDTFSVRSDGNGFSFSDAGDDSTRKIDDDSLRLQTDDDGSIDPVLLTIDGIVTPIRVDENASGTIVAFFEIDADDKPEELRAYPNAGDDRHVAWQFGRDGR